MTDEPSLYVLSPDVYVAGSTHLSGPPAALFNAYVARRDRVRFVVSPWVRDRMRDRLVEAGFDEELAEAQTRFVMSLCEWKDVDDADEPLLALARAAGVDAIYGPDPASGVRAPELQGLRFASVTELMSELGAVDDVQPGTARIVGASAVGELFVRDVRRTAKTLALDEQGLVSVDLSGARELPGLRQLQLDGNPLEALDLSPLGDVPGLSWVSVVCPELPEIDLAPLGRCPRLEAVALHPATRALNLDRLGPETYVLRQAAATGRLVDGSPAKWRFAAEARTVRLAYEGPTRRSSPEAIAEIDLGPLRWLSQLAVLDLTGNRITDLELAPLGACRALRYVRLSGNPLGPVDVTPLFGCADLQRFDVDPTVRLTARDGVRGRPLPPAFRRLVHRIDWR